MHPDINQALAQARIADLHRDAARHRLVSAAAPQRGGWSLVPERLAVTRLAVAGWITARTRPAQPACCPA